MINLINRVSTGIKGLDEVIDMLRFGDNVVCQVDSLNDYMNIIEPYLLQAKQDKRKIIYFRFGLHKKLINITEGIEVIKVNAQTGFEHFAETIHNHIEHAGLKAFYVFDCLTDLLKYWNSDMMIGNFFRVTCPFLFKLDTLAYFAILRNSHGNETIAKIRDTTQVLIDIYNIEGKTYIHPLKVWQRYSPTMFIPHLIQGDDAFCITASSEAAMLFSRFSIQSTNPDFWDTAFEKASKQTGKSGRTELFDQTESFGRTSRKYEASKQKLLSLLMSGESRMFSLCGKFFDIEDIIEIKNREIGTGNIGGKTIGMLLARKILENLKNTGLDSKIEMHDSFYLGADVFYTYIVENNCWELRTTQKTLEGYFKHSQELKKKILEGSFSYPVRSQFQRMLEYFGQSPIIVRSSSLLEDNFGNAFAGKYESVFCANQGSPEERLKAFENAVRTVYASTMSENALHYRMDRGLTDQDEQMAILIQRVSGDNHGGFFFPHIAGVGNSKNLYVWDESLDFDAGMLRLVFGLGTRAVDRTDFDYARIVCLDRPGKKPPIADGDEKKYSQHQIDLIDLKQNILTSIDADSVLSGDIGTDKQLFAAYDTETTNYKRQLKLSGDAYILDFKKLLSSTDFPEIMRLILKTLSNTYEYPVDIEFTANFKPDGSYKINILQCRPLQTKGLGKKVDMPDEKSAFLTVFKTNGNFMGGNVNFKIDYIIYIDPHEYLKLAEQERYGVARKIGLLNRKLKDKNAILVGPGRWGTTTTSLGVPVNFSEINNMLGIFEVAYKNENLMPELSYGSHFFQDLVESGIFYGAVYNGEDGVLFNEEYLQSQQNLLAEMTDEKYAQIIRVVTGSGLELYSDTDLNKMLCIESIKAKNNND